MSKQVALWMGCYLILTSMAVAAEPTTESTSTAPQSGSAASGTVDPNLDPGHSLNSARESFLQLDLMNAAAKIRQGSKQLRQAARDAAVDTRQSMLDTAEELESLGRRMEARGVRAVEELDRPFARAYHALAQHNLRAGQQHYQASEHSQAGHRLRMAADNLERMASSTGHRLGEAANEAVRDSRQLSGKLIEGAGYATDEVGQAFESLGKHVEDAGHRVEPVARRQSEATTK